MKKEKSAIFYCFSPLVMLTTFILEFLAAFFILLTGKETKINTIIILILLLLGAFQFAEYSICESFGFNADAWGRIGFISIALLPPLGLHLAYAVAHKKAKWPVGLAYGTALSWILLFLTNDIVQNQVCTENYLIFNMKENIGGAFFAYYYVWLLSGALAAFIFARQLKKGPQKLALYWFIAGYASFVIPATAIWIFSASAARGLPSIMCGFALVLAVILTLRVSPLAHKK